jgi:hypothetical protein
MLPDNRGQPEFDSATAAGAAWEVDFVKMEAYDQGWQHMPAG